MHLRDFTLIAVFPYSNKALKVLLEICQLQLDAYIWVCFSDATLLHLTIEVSEKESFSFANLMRIFFIAALADHQYTTRAIKSICLNFNMEKKSCAVPQDLRLMWCQAHTEKQEPLQLLCLPPERKKDFPWQVWNVFFIFAMVSTAYFGYIFWGVALKP